MPNKPREYYIFKDNVRFALKYILGLLLVLMVIAIICWDPLFWGFLAAVLIVYGICRKRKS